MIEPPPFLLPLSLLSHTLYKSTVSTHKLHTSVKLSVCIFSGGSRLSQSKADNYEVKAIRDTKAR